MAEVASLGNANEVFINLVDVFILNVIVKLLLYQAVIEYEVNITGAIMMSYLSWSIDIFD